MKLFFRTLNLLSLVSCLCLLSACMALRQPSGRGGLRKFVPYTDLERAQRNLAVVEKLQEALILQEHNDYVKAQALYLEVAKLYPEVELSAEALFQAGRIYYEFHEYDEAFKSFDKILKNYPLYKRFNEALDMQFKVATTLMEGKRPYYWGIIPGFKDYAAAILFFDEIVRKAPYSPNAPWALFYRAQVAYGHGKKIEAIDSLDRLIESYPEFEKLPEAYLLLGEVYDSNVLSPEQDQHSTQLALNAYEDFLSLFPNDPNVAKVEELKKQAQDRLARGDYLTGNFFYERRNQPNAARVFYNRAITVAPLSITARQSSEKLSLIDQGIKAPRTWVDILFGEYKDPLLAQ